MAFDLWTHQFCLACDKQTDGATYCSQSCRLADFEKSSAPTSSANSPSFVPQDYPWTLAAPKTSTSPPHKFYVSPAYDFSTAQPYGRTPQPQSYLSSSSSNNNNRQNLRFESSSPFSPSSSSSHPRHQPTKLQPNRSLTPSSSHSSLCSMQSASSTVALAETYQLSEKSRRELHAYHMNMEQARLQRRRSY